MDPLTPAEREIAERCERATSGKGFQCFQK
jgi:hypothetical protein